ncbi:hypothetical protein F0562_030510 [Nyssa sinensis]|uniref:Uncharacterized protein n=1 Tax=Nyssa sinensis TaxID=561372 RepID=A0A5J5B167_9ASTE|nr:hypothetical protein F0562_030510 [Nyssa sinensis]
MAEAVAPVVENVTMVVVPMVEALAPVVEQVTKLAVVPVAATVGMVVPLVGAVAWTAATVATTAVGVPEINKHVSSLVGVPQMKTSRADEKDFQTNYKDNQVQTSWIEKPNWSQTNTMTSRQGEQSQAYEKISRVKHEDKQVGSYQRYTAKEKVSHGEYVEKGSGQVGVKDEFKKSSTIKIGNKSGYTEYYSEERVRKVSYGNNSSSRNYGSPKRLTHDDY